MQLYFDTSALVKLVVREPESESLRSYISRHANDARFTAALSRTELVRAVTRSHAAEHGALTKAQRILGRLNVVALSNRLLDEAAALGPPELRTLDAIHLAAARTALTLRALVTYDTRLAEAAEKIGLRVAAPD